MATTAGGFLLVLALTVPAVGILLAFVLGGRRVNMLVFGSFAAGLAIAATILGEVWRNGRPLVYLVGGFEPPLGIALRADSISAVMLTVIALVMCAVGWFAWRDFAQPAGQSEARGPLTFWVLMLSVWCALNAVMLGTDLFNLYVALELLTFAAVPLVSLSGKAETTRAALRYLLFALIGSVLYLLGAALLYGGYGTLDMLLLAARIKPEPVALAAAALMTIGLLAKTALFPLHLWLPPAHAGAPPAGSAVLSALVVKGSLLIVVRLWFDAMAGLMTFAAAQILAALGTGAIVFGSIVALRQVRLKMLIAYSTLAQIGFMFLMLPLAFDASVGRMQSGAALTGGVLQVISHATAKAAMFMSAGVIYASLGHDRVAGLGGLWRVAPLAVLAFALGGIALTGLVPSGAYLAKGLLLRAADETGQPWLTLVVEASGMFTSSYLVLVLAHIFFPGRKLVGTKVTERYAEAVPAVALALLSLLVGFVPWDVHLLGPVDGPHFATSSSALVKSIGTLIAGALLAIVLRRVSSPTDGTGCQGGPVSRNWKAVRHAFGAIEWLNSQSQRWPTAMLFLLALGIIFLLALFGNGGSEGLS